ncbi:MAG: hemerythrin family protein [Lachnospiraceae bacterium]|nr:hemerythrin family protein [Lachnospiraceae bacterium]MDE7359099.1 hemerythrin family protein [Lachnospiraceae bacterium]
MSKEAEWDKRFNIGVASIDKAHQKLFSIVHRLITLSKDESSGQWACAEGIKYFKNYAIKHFADEEAYMQSIGYKGYDIHKRLHDDLRFKTLPALEKDLTESNYSQESIQHFIGICVGWLTAHIIIEDRAIAGMISNKWKSDHTGADMENLENALSATIQEIFQLQTDLVSEHYSGENFGRSMIIRLTYLSIDHEEVQIFMALEESLVLRAVSSILNIPLNKMDQLVMAIGKELAIQITEQVAIRCDLALQYHLESSHFMTPEQFLQAFYAGNFDYSLLFNTGRGYFAFVVGL